MQSPVQNTGNAAAIVTAGGSVMHYLPEWAAGLSIVWLVMQMVIHFPELKQRLREIFNRKEK